MTRPKLEWRRVKADKNGDWAARLACFEECWIARMGKGGSLAVTREYVFTAGKRFSRVEHQVQDLVDAMGFAEREMLKHLQTHYGWLIDVKVP